MSYPASSTVDRVVAEVGQDEVAQEHAAVRVRVRAHAPLAARGRARAARARAGRARRRAPPAGSSASTSSSTCRWSGVLACAGHRHLVRAPCSLDLLSVDLARARPALRCAQDDHRPPRALAGAAGARRLLDRAISSSASSSAAAKRWWTSAGVRQPAADEQRPAAVALEKRDELLARGSARGPSGWRSCSRSGGGSAGPLRRRGVQELVRVPARRERSGLGLAVADHAGDEQVGVVERRAVRVRERVAELAALVDRAGRLRRDVATGCRPGTRTAGRARASRPRLRLTCG